MYYYSTGKNSHFVVQIVKDELRKVGDWAAYSAVSEKQIIGWFWYNTNYETGYKIEDEIILRLKGMTPSLYITLLDIHAVDHEFFEFVIDKLGKSVWMFENEIERRNAIASHAPREVKYVIYDSNDYGIRIGEPIGTSIITTTGDSRDDIATAIKHYLAKTTGKPVDEVMGVGFYNAIAYKDYVTDREAHLLDLREKLDAAFDAAVWEDV